MRSRLPQGVMLATVVASLNGCGDLPVVGDLGATFSAIGAPVAGLLDPVLGRFFPKEEPSPPPRPRPRPRRRAAAANPAAMTPGATDSVAAAAVTQAPRDAYADWAERNRRFDKLRTDGLMQLYNGQTAGAIQSFKQAQALRPEDPHIANLVTLAQNPAPRAEAFGGLNKGPVGDPPGLPQPAMPQGTSGILNQLLKGAEGAQGDKPGGLF